MSRGGDDPSKSRLRLLMSSVAAVVKRLYTSPLRFDLLINLGERRNSLLQNVHAVINQLLLR
jgi:hypothetical protein